MSQNGFGRGGLRHLGDLGLRRDQRAAWLSDARDEAFPIYRNMTLHTLVLDGRTGRLDVWCCGRSAAHGPPVYRWELLPSSPFFGFAESLPAQAVSAN